MSLPRSSRGPVPAVVMGVAGSGKSTIAARLAAATGRVLVEGDDFHPPENIRKMSAGIGLTDDDRAGWLGRLAQELGSHPQGAVVSCSALKRVYRDRLRAAATDLRFVFLDVSPQLARERVLSRSGSHFFPPSVVESQFATLQDPSGEAGVLCLDATLPPEELTARAAAWLAGPPVVSLPSTESSP
jgi:gluconokinase